MDDKQIKEAINQQIKGVNVNPDLKSQTLNYIALKTSHSNLNYHKFKSLSLAVMTLATIILVVIVKPTDKTSSIQFLNEDVVTPISNNAQDNDRRALIPETVYCQFKRNLTEDSIDFKEDTSFITHNMTIHSLVLNGGQSYFLELSTDLSPAETTQRIESVMLQMEETLSSYQIIKMDDFNYFLYSGKQDRIIDLLQLIESKGVE